MFVDVSMCDNVFAMLSMPLSRYSAAGESFSGGRDWLTGGTPCYEVYSTSDGFISVGALEPKFWNNFCTAIERTEFIDRQFPDTQEGVKEMKAKVQEVLKQKSNAQWAAFFKDKDCCVEIGQFRLSQMRAFCMRGVFLKRLLVSLLITLVCVSACWCCDVCFS